MSVQRRVSKIITLGDDYRRSPLEKATEAKPIDEIGAAEFVPQPVAFSELVRLYDPYHSRCVNIKAMCSVGFGWDLESGGELRLPGNSHGETAQDVLNQCAKDIENTGNAWLEMVKAGGGFIGELHWLPSAQMEPSKDRKQVRQNTSGAGDKPAWPLWNGKWPDGEERCVLHIAREGTWSTYFGEPDWLGCIDSIMLAGSIRLYLRKTFDNNCMPSVMVSVIASGFQYTERESADGRTLPSEMDEFVDGFEKNFKGAQNAGKAFFQDLPSKDAKVQVDRLGSPLTDLKGLTEQLATCRDEIVGNHGVPPRLAGIVSAGSLGGGGEVMGQLKLFAATTIQDRHRMWSEALNPVLPMFQGVAAGARIQFRGLNLDELSGTLDANPTADPMKAIERMVKAARRG